MTSLNELSVKLGPRQSARIYLKVLNFEAQHLFVRYVEPLSAILKMKKRRVNVQDVKNGWKSILLSHPHDSICGCSVDAVHRDVEHRLRNSLELGASLVASYLGEFASKNTIAVFNPYERENKTVVNVTVNLEDENYELIDESGRKVECFFAPANLYSTMQKSGAEYLESLTYISTFQKSLSPKMAFAKNMKTLTFETLLPPLSVSFFRLKKIKVRNLNEENESTSFENDFYSFKLNDDGSFNLMDKDGGVTYENLNFFEDVADSGDEYNFSPVEDGAVVTLLGKSVKVVKVESHGFLKRIETSLKMKIPESLTSSRKKRRKNKKIIDLDVVYTLYRDAPRVDVKVTLQNRARDHKLSFVVKIPEKLTKTENDAYFGTVIHPIDMEKYGPDYAEEDISRYAMESFALFKGKKSKLLVTTRGIHEYETHITGQSTKATFTLLRAVGWLSRDDLRTRKGHAGPPIKTPQAQCLGKHVLKYSFTLLNEGTTVEAYDATRRYLCKPVAVYGTKGKRRFKWRLPFSLEKGLFLSAFKISQDDKRVILRVVNVGDSPKRLFLKENWKVRTLNMAEEIFESEEEKTLVSPFSVKTFELVK